MCCVVSVQVEHLLHPCRPGESQDLWPQRVIWRRLVVRYYQRSSPMDRAAWVLAFARTTQNVRHRTFDTEHSTPNVWHAPMIAADEAASIKRARSAIMHSYRC